MDLCKYKDILGVPGKGFHNHFFFGFAILDVLATLIVSYIISKKMEIMLFKVFLFFIVLGIILHKLFCVETVLNNILFG